LKNQSCQRLRQLQIERLYVYTKKRGRLDNSISFARMHLNISGQVRIVTIYMYENIYFLSRGFDDDQ